MDALEFEEQVRKRLAHDLHDGLGVKISMARLHLSSRYEGSENAEVKSCLQDSLEFLSEIHQELRTLLTLLAPTALQEGNLGAALESMIYKIEQLGNLSFSCDWSEDINQLELETCTQLYRIIQELLNNTIKHSQAKQVSVSIWIRETTLDLEYSDDGNGFDVNEVTQGRNHGFGLSSIQDRVNRLNGSATFESKVGEGMSFYLTIPLGRA